MYLTSWPVAGSFGRHNRWLSGRQPPRFRTRQWSRDMANLTSLSQLWGILLAVLLEGSLQVREESGDSTL